MRCLYFVVALAMIPASGFMDTGWRSWAQGELIAAEGFTAADYAQHVARLKKKVPGPEFSIVVQPPFVVIGDEPAGDVRRYAERTVKWAVDRLKAAYFEMTLPRSSTSGYSKTRRATRSTAGRSSSTPRRRRMGTTATAIGRW
jgi:hypothetical protein